MTQRPGFYFCAIYFFLGSVWGNSAPTVSPKQIVLLFAAYFLGGLNIQTPQEEKARAQPSYSGSEFLQKLCISTVDAPCW